MPPLQVPTAPHRRSLKVNEAVCKNAVVSQLLTILPGFDLTSFWIYCVQFEQGALFDDVFAQPQITFITLVTLLYFIAM